MNRTVLLYRYWNSEVIGCSWSIIVFLFRKKINNFRILNLITYEKLISLKTIQKHWKHFCSFDNLTRNDALSTFDFLHSTHRVAHRTWNHLIGHKVPMLYIFIVPSICIMRHETNKANFSSAPPQIIILQSPNPIVSLPLSPPLPNFALTNWNPSSLKSLPYSSLLSLFHPTHSTICQKNWIYHTIGEARPINFVFIRYIYIYIYIYIYTTYMCQTHYQSKRWVYKSFVESTSL